MSAMRLPIEMSWLRFGQGCCERSPSTADRDVDSWEEIERDDSTAARLQRLMSATQSLERTVQRLEQKMLQGPDAVDAPRQRKMLANFTSAEQNALNKHQPLSSSTVTSDTHVIKLHGVDWKLCGGASRPTELDERTRRRVSSAWEASCVATDARVGVDIASLDFALVPDNYCEHNIIHL